MTIKDVKILDHWSRPWSVLDYYKEMRNILKTQHQDALRAGERGKGPYFGSTPREIEARLSELRDELEQQVALLLTASFEAVFRVDLVLREKRRKRDPYSSQLRRRFTRREFHKVRLEEILDCWKELVGKAHVVGDFKQVVNFRHWLAHGRYWKQESGLRALDPYEVWSRGNAVLAAVPILPEVDYAPPPETDSVPS